jgi:hypothetical protein
MRKTSAVIAFVLLSLLLADCATAAAPPAPVVTMATAATTNGPPAAAPAPSPSACTSNACLTKQIQHDLLSVVAKDGAVITKAACRASTLKHNAGAPLPCTARSPSRTGPCRRGTLTSFPRRTKSPETPRTSSSRRGLRFSGNAPWGNDPGILGYAPNARGASGQLRHIRQAPLARAASTRAAWAGATRAAPVAVLPRPGHAL